jgi:hypothetical protein
MNLTRRDFLKASGGLAFAFCLPIAAEANTQAAAKPSTPGCASRPTAR